MPSKIETEILIPYSLLALSKLEINLTNIVIGMSQWEEIHKVFRFTFAEANIRSFITNYSNKDLIDEPNYLQLPWDIIGIESDSLDDDRWKFVFTTHALEIVFEARWPNYDLSKYE